MQTTYKVIEIDANDKTTVLRSGVTRANALEILARLRATYGKWQPELRYVMYRDARKPLGQSDKPEHQATVLP